MSFACCFGGSSNEAGSEPQPPPSGPPPPVPSRSTLGWFRKLYGSSWRTNYSDSTASTSFNDTRRRRRAGRHITATTDETPRRASDEASPLTYSNPTLSTSEESLLAPSYMRRFTRRRAGRKVPPAAPPKTPKAQRRREDPRPQRQTPGISKLRYFKIKNFWERLSNGSTGRRSKGGRAEATPPKARPKLRDGRGMSVPSLESNDV